MKTSRLLLVAGLLTLGTTFLTAGPGPQFWAAQTAAATARDAAAKNAANVAVAPVTTTASTPMAAMCATCACCKKA